MMLKDIHTKYT